VNNAREIYKTNRPIRETKIGETVIIRPDHPNTLWYGDKYVQQYSGSYLQAKIVKINPSSVTVEKGGKTYKVTQAAKASMDVTELLGKDKQYLTDIWNKAQTETIKTQTITGEKPSGVAKSIEAKAIEEGLIKDGFGELAGYDPVKIKEQAQLASDLLTRDFDKAIRIIEGTDSLPEGLKGSAFLKGVEQYAMETKDGELMSKLAKSNLATEASTAGQTLRLLAEKDPNSPVAKIQEIERIRENVAEKKLKGKKPEVVKSEIKNSLKEKINKSKPSKYTWEKFIDEITF